MKKIQIVIVIIALVIIAGAFYLLNKKHSNIQTQTNQTETNQTQPTQNTTVTSSTSSVTISNFSFNPSSLTVKKGTMVTWTNQDPTLHTVTGDNGGPSSQKIPQGTSYDYTFNTVGNFIYHCSIHPSMTGVVTVTE